MDNIKNIQVIVGLDDGNFREVLILDYQKFEFIEHIKSFFKDGITLKDEKHAISLELAREYANDFFCLSDVRKKSRKREYVDARKCAMYYLMKNEKHTLDSISKEFGYKDHSMSVENRNVFQDLMDTDVKYSNMYIEFCNFVNKKQLENER